MKRNIVFLFLLLSATSYGQFPHNFFNYVSVNDIDSIDTISCTYIENKLDGASAYKGPQIISSYNSDSIKNWKIIVFGCIHFKNAEKSEKEVDSVAVQHIYISGNGMLILIDKKGIDIRGRNSKVIIEYELLNKLRENYLQTMKYSNFFIPQHWKEFKFSKVFKPGYNIK